MANFKDIISHLRLKNQYRRYSSFQKKFEKDFSFTGAVENYKDRNLVYAYMHHYLHNNADKRIQEHRQYFSENKRGFGEDSLHSMWWTIFREYKPLLVLEIGVYRGQVITLWGVIASLLGINCAIHGISPFSPAGDLVSSYLENLDYLNDTIESNKKFGLPDVHLYKGFSTDADALAYIKNRSWDLIYVDGNHDFEVALADYLISKDSLKKGGILVMDDSSLYTDFRPTLFSFAGHPGPSRVVKEYAMKEMIFLGGVGHNNVFQKK